VPSRDKDGNSKETSPGDRMKAEERTLRWLQSPRISAENRERVAQFASSGLPVFLRGEEGTGKGEVAKALHFLGPWRGSPMLRLSPRGLTPPKFVEKLSLWLGAGRSSQKVSLSLYWEEVESLEGEMQAILVDLLADQQVHWPGLEEVIFDVQILSSSSAPLTEAVAAKRFREDLFRTLETLTLYLPPLRERKGEIPRLVDEILRERMPEGENPKRFSPEALQALQAYEWPGNVPELESLVLRSAAMKEGTLLSPGDLVFSPSPGSLSRGTQSKEDKEPWFEITIPTLAHEIKNPLVAISTFAHLLPDKFEDPEFRQEFSRLVSQDVHRINDLLENLLEFAQFTAPRGGLLDLNAALEEVLQEHEKMPLPKGKEILTDLAKGLPPVLFDKSQLGFILRNLLENAFSKGNPEGPLHLSTRFSREEGGGAPADFVDLILWYNSREGALRTFSKVVGLEAGPDFQNLNMALLLIRRVMVRNQGKMQVLQEDDGGMTVRLQFPAGNRREGALRENYA
jgi:two-component sensor histidine kinase